MGERDGDAKAISDNHCGLWESFDGGKTFEEKNYFNPLSPRCQDDVSQVVNAVVITDKSTTIISTHCGLRRKELSAPTFSVVRFLTSSAGESFTGIAIFKDWIVARTYSSIFISNDDGKNWEEHPIQLSYPNQNFTQDYIGARGGNYSVSIIQLPGSSEVFVYVPVTRSPNSPGNMGSSLVFNNQTKQWSYQIIEQAGLGIVNGGRVFIKSFLIRCIGGIGVVVE